MYFTVFALLALACGQNTSDSQKASADRQEDKPLVVDQYTLSPFSDSPLFNDATINGYTFSDGKWNFDVSGEEYALGAQTPDAGEKGCANSAKGQHIHLIVDNKPYSAQYTSEFSYDLEEGEHYLLAFLSRSYHESLKHPEARVAQQVMVSEGKITKQEDIDGPMLFYSRPKGTYIGDDTKSIMLDFYALNAQIGKDHVVRATINGEPHIIREWKPMYLTGLPMGENTIELELLDMEMNSVDIPLNPVSRTFTLKELPEPNPTNK